MNISIEPERLLDPVYLAILANMIEVDCMGSDLACGHWLVLNLIWSHLLNITTKTYLPQDTAFKDETNFLFSQCFMLP